jgi:hypothetical protein
MFYALQEENVLVSECWNSLMYHQFEAIGLKNANMKIDKLNYFLIHLNAYPSIA